MQAQVREDLSRLDLHLFRADLGEYWVLEGLCDVHALVRVEDEGAFEEVDPFGLRVVEQGG